MEANLIDDQNTVRKICKEEGYIYNLQSNTGALLSMLTSYYNNLPSIIKDEWEVFATGFKYYYGMFRHDRGAQRYKLRAGVSHVVGTGRGLFTRLNHFACARKVLNQPRIYAPISVDIPPSPTNLSAQSIDDKIILQWEDYNPHIDTFKGNKIAHIYFTLYYRYYAVINNKKYIVPGKILTVLAHPSPEQFTLKYLMLPHNVLVKLSDVKYVTLKFQMDTFVLVDDFAPMISSMSNMCVIEWSKEGLKKNEEIVKTMREFTPDDELIKGKEPLYMKSFRLVRYTDQPDKYKIEKEYLNKK